MITLHAQLTGKTLLAFSRRESAALATLVQTYGATVVLSDTALDVFAALGALAINGAILDVEADAETLFDIAEALETRQIPFVFAAHVAPADLLSNFTGYKFPLNPEELGVIADHLFGAPVVH